jgi:hypothetical protein
MSFHTSCGTELFLKQQTQLTAWQAINLSVMKSEILFWAASVSLLLSATTYTRTAYRDTTVSGKQEHLYDPARTQAAPYNTGYNMTGHQSEDVDAEQ